MRVRAGTSGYSYDEWKGTFYPAELSNKEMLAFYSRKLPTVEVNNTFYRMPRKSMVESWTQQTPGDFRFVVKASRRITHIARLHDCADTVSYLFDVLAPFGAKLGPVLFQLPPFFKKDVALLESFLAMLPDGVRAAFEFRNRSWFADEVYDVLKAGGAVLCAGDVDDEKKNPPLVVTADWGYLRLRRSDYGDADLDGWVGRISEQPWGEAYAFFKHEERGPELAERLNAAFS